MEIPVLDGRTKEDIYQQIVTLAESYVPEWNTEEVQEDVGHMLSKMFAEMFEETLYRFNKISYKNLVYFLNLMGADLLPCISSKGCVTIKINEGTQVGVPIQKGTCAYGQDVNNERVIFQLKDDLLAVDNCVEAVYCKSTQQNKIVKSYEVSDKLESSSFCLFDFYGSKNLQEYRFFLCSDEVFFIQENSKIILQFIHEKKPYVEEKVAQRLADTHFAKWEYLTEQGWQTIKSVKTLGNQIELWMEEEIPVMECFEKESHWISCTLLEPNQFEDICFTNVNVASTSEGILPDSLYHNDISLTKKEFLPFGETFSVYDDFYINCNYAFTKKGALVHLNFEMDVVETPIESLLPKTPIKWKPFIRVEEMQEAEKQDVFVDKVLWEYWNGNGWARLFDDNRYEDFFRSLAEKNKTMSFHCPQDMETAFVGADYGRWIRARILSVNQAFQLEGNFIAPLVKNVSIDYHYQEELGQVDDIYIKKDLEVFQHHPFEEEEVQLANQDTMQCPSTYLALRNPLKGGPTKLFFPKEGVSFSTLPSLKWEYWTKVNGVCRWKELKVHDETNCFQKSGIVTFVCKDKFEQKKLFGKLGYWIRLVNIDQQYDTFLQKDRELLPKLKGIHFNTVRVDQQETMNTEYFSLDQQEPHKKCYLNSSNLLSAKVWVDEVEKLIGEERYFSLHKGEKGIRAVADEQGVLTEYWVEWNRVDSFVDASPEDRVFILDEKNSYIQFGDGIHGKIPFSNDGESIQVDYTVSVGQKGNFQPFQIQGFSDAVPFVESVTNLYPITGGCNQETLDQAIKRSFTLVKHQNKVVSQDDYAMIAKEADRNIIDVKTMVGVNGKGERSTGNIVVAVLPRVINASDDYFEGMKQNLLNQFSKKAPAVLIMNDKIEIIEAQYIEYCISIQASVGNYNDYQAVYQEIETRLEQYLHPITGNFGNTGFKMGQLPNKMKLYNYLKNIERLIEIQSIHIFCYKRIREYRKEVDYDEIFDLPFAVPINGIHDIDISII